MPSIYIAVKNSTEFENKLLNDARALMLYIDTISSIGEEAGLKRLDEYIFAPLEDIKEFLINSSTTEDELTNADTEVCMTLKKVRNCLATISHY